jgi:hypothetical protein
MIAERQRHATSSLCAKAREVGVALLVEGAYALLRLLGLGELVEAGEGKLPDAGKVLGLCVE